MVCFRPLWLVALAVKIECAIPGKGVKVVRQIRYTTDREDVVGQCTLGDHAYLPRKIEHPRGLGKLREP